MGKLIFLDVDGTIAGPGEPPRPSTVEAIHTARSRGHKVFLSTGRLEADVAENVRAIGALTAAFTAPEAVRFWMGKKS